MEEFVEVMRILWRDEVSSYQGEFARFEAVRSYPKPTRGRVPVVIGGNSDAALGRVVTYGDGWYGFNLSKDEVPGRIAHLRERCRQADRDPSTLETAVSLRDGSGDDVAALASLGVTELVVVESPPDDPEAADAWIASLASRWGVTPESAAGERPDH